MALFTTPEKSAANPPESWVVVKRAERIWHLVTADKADDASATPLGSFATKREAEAARESGWLVNLYREEARWYAGESVNGWRPYADVAAENEARRVRKFTIVGRRR